MDDNTTFDIYLVNINTGEVLGHRKVSKEEHQAINLECIPELIWLRAGTLYMLSQEQSWT